MVDPITTLTTSAIATLVFQKFIESGAGEVAKRFSTEAMAQHIRKSHGYERNIRKINEPTKG